jgi:BirA family biotin operon repressor/biotin-[acetyl-CoA-carboxylase] ligase
LLRLPTIDSTNEEVRRHLQDASIEEGLVVTAWQQTAGRGRRGRAWQSPAGNLSVSFLIRAGATLTSSAHISFVAAVALQAALSEIAPLVSARLKWPNDVLVNGRKISGILLEAEGPWVILGIGVNLAHSPDPTGIGYHATSLAELGVTVTLDEMLEALARHLHQALTEWRQGGFAAIRHRWRAHAEGLGGPLVARLYDGSEIHGRFTDLDDEGALLLTAESGQTQRIIAADIHFPPPLARG